MPPPHGGGGADLPGARTSNNNSGFPTPATQNPFENQAFNTEAFHAAGGAAAGGGAASRGVAGGLIEAPASTNSGAGVVEDLFGVGGGAGPGAMVPYGQQQPLESHPLHLHHHHHAAHQQQHPTYQGAIVPFQQQQQQQAGGSGGTSVTASNPFDDLLGGVSTAVGTGSGAGILQQQYTQQPHQQQWPGHPFAGSLQQYPQQQHHHQQQQSWLGQGGAARNGDAAADGGLQPMQSQYPPHQQQLQIAPVQQPFQQQQQLQTVAPGNPFFDAAQDLPQQQQKGCSAASERRIRQAPGANLFGDDPFGSVNSGSKMMGH
ncbi:unnamed protein product [Ectocarpus sp. CCAP 1310/34]|nr:unnamed protein product [Ectocarpus sp. CCAP 1310/34]